MFFDQLTIILSSITLLLAVAAPFCSPFYRFRKIVKRFQSSDFEEKESAALDSFQEENSAQEPSKACSIPAKTSVPITVLLTVHDQAKELEMHLSSFLSQEFDNDFQVVVVAEQGDSETEDVLKRYENDSHLYATFIPSSSRYMSKKKLAVTLGVKAAKYEWIIMTDAGCTPASPYWLQCMSKACNENNKLVLGYSNYMTETADFRRLEQLYTELYLMRKAENATANRTNSANLAFRKSMFLQGEGYRGNLHLLRGEYDFIVNKYADEGSSALMMEQDAWIIEDEPLQKKWLNKHLFYQETRKYLNRSTPMRMLFNLDTILLHTSYLFILAMMVYGGVLMNYTLLLTAVVSLLLTVILRVRFAKRTLTYFLEDIALWKVIPFEISMMWRNLSYRLRYVRADKNDFTSHKL